MGAKIRWGAALLMLAAAYGANGQTAGAAGSGPRALVSLSAAAFIPTPNLGEIVREIDDPHLGDRWLLIRDSSHPGGPGRLVLMASPSNQVRQDQAGVGPSEVELRPVIHAGERLIVEENTALVEARLEAVALGPALAGAPLDVRLAIGGKVVRATALAPGRAAFLTEREARP